MAVVKVKKNSEDNLKVQDSFSLNEENQLLKSSLNYLKAELNKFKDLPLLVAEVRKIVGKKALIRVPNGSNFLVNIAGDLQVTHGDSVLVEQRSLTVVQRLEETKNFDVENFLIVEKPNVTWEQLGGLKEQINEIKEVVELPLLKPELFKKIGIDPPKGILLYGPPGTGKTLLAKAVATSSNSTFIELVGSELVQKFIGEGAKLVKDLFKLAKEKAPTIIFIDELDAIAAERVDIGTSGEREVQRTLMQLLTEIDGFSNLDNVKVIAATNRFDILDPAVLRPGRFDRLIEVDLPDSDSRLNIFKVHSRNMQLNDIDFKIFLDKTEGFSGADIKAVCTEAGYFAIRQNRTHILVDDFHSAIEKVAGTDNQDQEYAGMFG
jgi:proteasome regulatory subunit